MLETYEAILLLEKQVRELTGQLAGGGISEAAQQRLTAVQRAVRLLKQCREREGQHVARIYELAFCSQYSGRPAGVPILPV